MDPLRARAEIWSYSALVSRVKAICSFNDTADEVRVISGLRWIGLFTQEPVVPRAGNLLDTLCARLEKLMAYEPGERDLVMLQHKFVVERADGTEVRGCALPPPFMSASLTVGSANPHVDARGVRRAGRTLCDGPHCGCALWHCHAVGSRRGHFDTRRAGSLH